MTLKMPAHTQRAHFEPPWTGDSLPGIDKVARMHLGSDGIRAGDFNFQWAWNDPKDHSKGGCAYCMHWGNAGQNNFHYILVKNKVRRMTKAELKRSITKWPAAQVRNWRRGPSKDSARPRTYRQMVRYAKKKNVTVIAELKSRAFGEKRVMKTLIHSANLVGHPPYYMALYGSMPLCKQKCAATIQSGGYFAVIFGRFQKLRKAYHAAVRTWKYKPTREW